MSEGRFADTQCPHCGGGPIGERRPAAGAAAIVEGRLACTACHASFDEVWGVPFLGRYEREDILGLFEIAANIDNRGRFGVTPAVVEDWERMLAAYHAARDKAAFVAARPEAQSPYLEPRYAEWLAFRTVAAGLDLAGKAVLDLGAGLGFDAHRLAMAGARVTALEFSPVLAAWGAAHFPHMRWIGGFAHALPFREASFDAVFCNAALHHMRDIPAAVAEALRVLRPGGVLITAADRFRASTASEADELRSWDSDPAVLMGVNERIPPFAEFIRTLLDHRERLDVALWTLSFRPRWRDLPAALVRQPMSSPTYARAALRKAGAAALPARLAPGGAAHMPRPLAWDFDRDLRLLAGGRGSLALKVRLRAPVPDAPRLQHSGVLAPATLAQWLEDAATAFARLAPLVPETWVNAPFPGHTASKFELLNGWRLPEEGCAWRTGYRRARWFLRRRPGEEELEFELQTPAQRPGPAPRASIFVNGTEAASVQPTAAAWTPVRVPLDAAAAGAPFAVEIRLAAELDGLDAASFRVRHRRFGTASARRAAA